jgi:quinol monooxygenase YgiN
MHVLIVHFRLKDLSEEGYRALCDELAPTVAAAPGLLAKVWLASPATNTYGGVYTWRNRAAMDAFLRSELFAAVLAHPNLTDVTTADHGVLEGPTRVTGGLAPAPVTA